MEEIAKHTQNLTQNRREIFCVGLAFLFGVGLALLPQVAAAASLYFSPSSGSYNIGQNFSIAVYVSSVEQTMNAASGVISFPIDKLEVTSLSKTGSIFNLWVQEPLFYNSAGTVQFEGIVLNPGFIGSSGKIISVNFRVKSAGTANLNFFSGSVLAADGKGTNILTNINGGVYTLEPSSSEEQYIPPPTSEGTPAAPIVYSLTHPDPEKWYSNNNPEFSWNLPPDVTGVSLLFHKKALANPGSISDGLIETANFEEVENGTWYFHIKFKNKNGWGEITHRKVLVDTIPPEPFKIEVDNEGDPTNPSPVLHFASQDALSGIVYYEIKIGDKNAIPITAAVLERNPFKLPAQGPGKHRVITTAIDAAGNLTSATTDLEIEPIEQPIITDLSEKVEAGDILTIKGISKYPDATIAVFIKKEGEEPIAMEVKTDIQGNWTFIYDKSLEKGIYQVWLEITDHRGAKSYPTEKITIAATLPALIKIGEIAIDYLTIIITLIALIVFLIVVIAYSWYRISLWRKKLRKETKEIEENVVRAFRALREEVQEQIEYLDKKRGLNKSEKRVHDKLEEALKISKEFISKEIKDVLKELE